MEALTTLYAEHPFWVWMGVAALLLAVEVSVGTEWLLWPAAAAAVTGVATILPVELTLAGELIVFSILTIAGALLSRHLIRRAQPSGEDLNDRSARLIGRTGEVVSPFVDGCGRVLVDGAEWPADLSPGAGAPTGRVRVSAVQGSRLVVEPA